MDKKVIFAVAGSGKTTYILNQLGSQANSLIITYTNNNLENLKEGILNKFKCYPENIHVMSYFNFLYSFCYRPFLSYKMKAAGINWKPNINKFAQQDERFVDDFGRLYSNRIAKLIEAKGVVDKVKNRLEKFYQTVYIDEIQDFAGNDFKLLENIANVNINLLFVGDFYQHTFDTSRDGSINKNLHNNSNDYMKRFQKAQITIDQTTLIKSHRCSPTVCDFISKTIGISMQSHRNDTTTVKVITNIAEALLLVKDNSIIKLFYKEHKKFNCYSKNWGDCKGEDRYHDVCVVLNENSWSHLKKESVQALPSLTKNKLYVACSRAKGNLYLISEEFLKNKPVQAQLSLDFKKQTD